MVSLASATMTAVKFGFRSLEGDRRSSAPPPITQADGTHEAPNELPLEIAKRDRRTSEVMLHGCIMALPFKKGHCPAVSSFVRRDS
jgi:hypothetical protein